VNDIHKWKTFNAKTQRGEKYSSERVSFNACLLFCILINTGCSKSLCAPGDCLPHYLAQSDCLVADRQGQGETGLTLTPSVIPNSNYVIMVND
jgi:hypothetical protein